MAGQRAAAPSTRCASPGEILCSLRERELCHDHAVVIERGRRATETELRCSADRVIRTADRDINMRPMCEVPNIALLLHGTWGRNENKDADWCASDSRCCRAIRRALGNETLICRVNWSGANSAHARFAARDVLATTIRSMRDRHPHAQRRAGAGPDGEMA